MITERDLKEAIAECEGTKKPNANTCIKLAAYYTILENLYGQNSEILNSHSMAFSSSNDLDLTDSELSDFIRSKGLKKCIAVLDDLLNTLAVVNPRLHESVLHKLEDL